MALQGTLDTFSLPDVLRLLATTTKTGRLRIEGDRGQGSVWMREGAVVDADADRAVDGTPADEVIFELLRFDSGSFSFESDSHTPNAENPDRVEDLLRRANALLSEWAELEAIVPSLDHHVSLTADLSTDEVTIDADRWHSLVAVAAGRSVRELARAMGLSELHVSRVVRDLVELGVADVDQPTGVPEPARLTDAPIGEFGRTGPSRALRGGRSGRGGSRSEQPADNGRAGWRQPERNSGPHPAVAPDALIPPPPVTNGQGRASAGRSSSAPAPAEGTSNGRSSGSRLGRRRSASADDSESGAAPTPSRGGASTNGNGARDATGPLPGLPIDLPVLPPAGVSELPPAPSLDRSPFDTPSPFTTNGLGTGPVLPVDTGQMRAVSPPSLPPDLHWSGADDLPPATTGPITSPFSIPSSLGPPPAAGPADGEVAPHVAAMSGEARAAVETAVGYAGGWAPTPGPNVGDEVAQRGRLLHFLSSVR